MAETKYGKYVIKAPITRGGGGQEGGPPSINLREKADLFGANYSMVWACITKPVFMEKESHSHDFDQILVFLGADSMNVEDFGAEVELSLGEEGEKQIITSSTFVYVPKGLVHCPLNFKRIDKPIVFQEILLAPSYKRREPSS
jgi:hypothetical protein